MQRALRGVEGSALATKHWVVETHQVIPLWRLLTKRRILFANSMTAANARGLLVHRLKEGTAGLTLLTLVLLALPLPRLGEDGIGIQEGYRSTNGSEPRISDDVLTHSRLMQTGVRTLRTSREFLSAPFGGRVLELTLRSPLLCAGGKTEVPFEQWQLQNTPGTIVLADNAGSVTQMHARTGADRVIDIVRTVTSARVILAVRAEVLVVGIGATEAARVRLALLLVRAEVGIREIRASEYARIPFAVHEIDRAEVTPVRIGAAASAGI